MNPQEFVEYVANDWVELSHDKVRVQRDDYIRLAKKILAEQQKQEDKGIDTDEENTMAYPLMKQAVVTAYVCGLSNLDEAWRNWDRSLQHCCVYAEIPEKVREANKEIGKSLEALQNDTETYWNMSLKTANEVFNLDIDFDAEDRYLDAELAKEADYTVTSAVKQNN